MDTWVPIETEKGTWAVYWPRVRRILTWYHRSELMLANWKKVPIEDTPLSWGDILWDPGYGSIIDRLIREPVYSMDVDWKKVHERADANTEAEMRAFQSGGHAGSFDDHFMRWLSLELAGRIVTSQRNKVKFLAINRKIQDESMQNVATNVDRWDIPISGARLVRDVCADIFLICVGILTGGAGGAAGAALRGALVKGASSGVIRGACKWQDTGEFGSGAVTMGGEVVAALIPLKVNGVTKIVLVAGTKGVAEGGATIVEGKDFADAMEKATWKAGGEVAKEVFKSTAFKNMVSQKAVLANGKISGEKLVGEIAAKESSRMLKAAAKSFVARAEQEQRTARRVNGFMQRYTYYAKRAENLTLLSLAMVPPEGYTVGQWRTKLAIAQ